MTDKRYTENNPINNSNMIILATSHDGHMKFLKYALTQYRKTGKYVVCLFDSRHNLIPDDIWNIPHAWIFKHKTYGAEKRNGWLWHISYGASIVNFWANFKYVFNVNCDCVWDRPEGVKEIIELLGNNDLMSSSSNGTIHTCSVIWKREAFLTFADYVKEKLKVNKPESYSPEVLLKQAVEKFKLKNKIPEIQARYWKGHRYEGQIDHYSARAQDSTWKRILGFRNIGAEINEMLMRRLSPIDKKYFDMREEYFTEAEKPLLQYYMTGDKRYLEMAYDRNEDSWFDRKYYPLDHYGKDPIC